jgi:hypothetical protein
MALEGLTAEQIDEYEKELLKQVPESSTIGNVSLSNALGWDQDSLYWDIRNRLIERGVLVQGRGRGGSVRRLIADSITSGIGPEEVSPTVLLADEAAARESDL